jgi:hypothetical protein
MDLGIMVEGFVEVDPISGRVLLRIPHEDGNRFLDIQEHLAAQRGKEVRLIVTPLEAIAELAKMVEAGEVTV